MWRLTTLLSRQSFSRQSVSVPNIQPLCLGYGHNVPETRIGKIVCVIYSIVGIPLCLVAFQTVGNKINNLLHQWFSKSTLTRGVVIPQICLIFLVFLYSFSGAGIFATFEGLHNLIWANYNPINY